MELSKAKLKEYALLRMKKYRHETGLIFVEGLHQIEEVIASRYPVLHVIASDSWLEKNDPAERGIPAPHAILTAGDKDFEKLSDTEQPQGIGAIVDIRTAHTAPAEPFTRAIYLDRISDPGNLGTIFRTARWFGINDIILSRDTADVFNPKVVRSSLGAVFHLRFTEAADDGAYITGLLKQGYHVAGADMDGENIFTAGPLPEPWVLVIGSEAHGLSPEIRKRVKNYLSIPKLGGGESLNAAVAAAVLLAEITK